MPQLTVYSLQLWLFALIDWIDAFGFWLFGGINFGIWRLRLSVFWLGFRMFQPELIEYWLEDLDWIWTCDDLVSRLKRYMNTYVNVGYCIIGKERLYGILGLRLIQLFGSSFSSTGSLSLFWLLKFDIKELRLLLFSINSFI